MRILALHCSLFGTGQSQVFEDIVPLLLHGTNLQISGKHDKAAVRMCNTDYYGLITLRSIAGIEHGLQTLSKLFAISSQFSNG